MRLLLLSLLIGFLPACTMDPAWPTDRYRPCTDDTDCLNNCNCLDGLCVPPEGSMPPSTCGCMREADCEDDDPCTEQSCNTATGACESDPIEGCCHSRDDCDDLEPCTEDSCVNNACQHPYICGDCNLEGCDESWFCHEASGECVACLDDGHCDDPDPCTLNTCTPDHNCDFSQIDLNAACDDGLECTVGDVCMADGTCVGSPSAWSEICFNSLDEDCDGAVDQYCLGEGDFSFESSAQGDNDSLLGLVAADFDGDRILDLFSAEVGQSGNSLLLGQGNLGFGNGSFDRDATGGCSPVEFFVSRDFNGDLLPDMALLCQSTDEAPDSLLQLLSTGPGGRLTARDLLALPPYPKGMAGGDFDRDGQMDLLVTFSDQAPLAILYRDTGVSDTPFVVRDTCLNDAGDTFFCQGPVAAGDFDGDSWMDVACSDQRGIHLLINQGLGCTSTSGIEFRHIHALEQDLPYWIRPIVLDLNRDGRPDLAAINPTPGNTGLMIFIGTSTGGGPTFDALADISLAVDEHSHLVAGDFDNDALMDLAVSSGGTANNLKILLAKGEDATWTFDFDENIITLSGMPTGLATGDFDADGISDLAVQIEHKNTDDGTMIQILQGSGAGGRANAAFEVLYPCEPLAWASLDPVQALLSQDLNNDGLDDMAVGGVGGLQVFFAQGDDARPSGGFDASVQLSLGTPIEWITSGDLDGDGYLDLVAGSGASTEMLYFQGIAGGGFDVKTISFNHSQPTFNADGVMLDVDRDGRDELFVLHRPLPQGGVPGFSIASEFNGETFSHLFIDDYPNTIPQDLVATDFNQDGWVDLVLLLKVGDTQQVKVWSNQRTNASNIVDRFHAISTTAVPNTAILLDSGDLNGDGWPDVAVAGGGMLQVLRNVEGISLAQAFDDSNYFNIENLMVKDLDRDGLCDVVLLDSVGGRAQLVVIKVTEGTADQWVFFSEPTPYSLDFAQSGGLAAGRFNHDGFLDLAVGDGSGGMGIQLLLGQGDCY